jgi:hypothetical protein
MAELNCSGVRVKVEMLGVPGFSQSVVFWSACSSKP